MLFSRKTIVSILMIMILSIMGYSSIYLIMHYDSNGNTQGSEPPTSMQPGSGAKAGMPANQHNSPDFLGDSYKHGEDAAITPGSDHGDMKGPSGAGQAGKQNGIITANPEAGKILEVYSAVFFISIAVSGYFVLKKKGSLTSQRTVFYMIVLLGIGFFLRLCLATTVAGHSYDIKLFKSWAENAARSLTSVYSGSYASDYPPLYMYVLYLVGKVSAISVLKPYIVLLIKLPSIFADLISSLLLYKLAQKHISRETGIWLAVAYVFNPAVLINSSLWGQVDSFFTLIVAAAIWLLSERRLLPASVFFAAAVLMKPQGIIFLPVLFFELVNRRSVRDFVMAAATALGTAIIVILPFVWNNGVLWIFKLYTGTIGEYPYASVNAFNFFSLLGANHKKDTSILLFTSYHIWGLLFIVAATLFSGYVYLRGRRIQLVPYVALFMITAVFTFSSSMHERYLFPSIMLAMLAFIKLRDTRIAVVAFGLSVTSTINEGSVLFGLTDITNLAHGLVPCITSILNIFFVGFIAWIMLDLSKKTQNI